MACARVFGLSTADWPLPCRRDRHAEMQAQFRAHWRCGQVASAAFTLETGWSWAYTQSMRVEKPSDRRNRRADGALSGRRQFLAQLTGLAAGTALASKARGGG